VRRLHIPPLAAAICVAIPTSVSAADGTSGSAFFPLLLKYDLCALSAPAVSQQAVHDRCATERRQITNDAENVIRQFYPSAQLEARRGLQLQLSGTERYAAMLTRTNESYGLPVLRYSQCLAENALSDSDYLRGSALFGEPIAKKCGPLYDELVAALSTSRADRQIKQRLGRLKTIVMNLYATPASEFGVSPPWVDAR
jgi:hypothetical protein